MGFHAKYFSDRVVEILKPRLVGGEEDETISA